MRAVFALMRRLLSMALLNALVARFDQDEEGQGLAEYALILALIAIVAIVALIFLGGQISDILHAVGASVYPITRPARRPPAPPAAFCLPEVGEADHEHRRGAV